MPDEAGARKLIRPAEGNLNRKAGARNGRKIPHEGDRGFPAASYSFEKSCMIACKIL